MNIQARYWVQLFGLGLAGLISLEMSAFYPSDFINKGLREEASSATTAPTLPDGLFRCENGKVHFKSDAALEVIQAKSTKLRGAIDPAKQTFAWTVEMSTFEGFNSALQREHFKENYLETDEFPKAIFQGKIIENIDFQKDGTYTIRAKGKLLIHGVEQERILKSQLELKNGKATIHSDFTVLLSDHNINIPRIVHQKIAEEIAVTVDAEMKML